MLIEISRGYRRDLRRARNAVLRRRVALALAAIEAAASVEDLPGAERVRHPRRLYYRLRVGDYRLIFEPVGDTAKLVRFRHRNEAYKNLPG